MRSVEDLTPQNRVSLIVRMRNDARTCPPDLMTKYVDLLIRVSTKATTATDVLQWSSTRWAQTEFLSTHNLERSCRKLRLPSGVWHAMTAGSSGICPELIPAHGALFSLGRPRQCIACDTHAESILSVLHSSVSPGFESWLAVILVVSRLSLMSLANDLKKDLRLLCGQSNMRSLGKCGHALEGQGEDEVFNKNFIVKNFIVDAVTDFLQW